MQISILCMSVVPGPASQDAVFKLLFTSLALQCSSEQAKSNVQFKTLYLEKMAPLNEKKIILTSLFNRRWKFLCHYKKAFEFQILFQIRYKLRLKIKRTHLNMCCQALYELEKACTYNHNLIGRPKRTGDTILLTAKVIYFLKWKQSLNMTVMGPTVTGCTTILNILSLSFHLMKSPCINIHNIIPNFYRTGLMGNFNLNKDTGHQSKSRGISEASWLRISSIHQ